MGGGQGPPPTSGLKLSGGQQQRLCLARILAVKPEFILLDEPTSGLDPISTMKIEESLRELKKDYTIVLVTNNTKQAARVADRTAFFLSGQLVEMGPTAKIFTAPATRGPTTTSGEVRIDAMAIIEVRVSTCSTASFRP